MLPRKTDLIIFDNNEYEMLLSTVIPREYTAQLMDSSISCIYLNPIFLFVYIITVIKNLLTGSKVKSALYKSYLLCILKFIKPKAVITFTDNSLVYHWLVKYYKKARFIAIQNGVRQPYQFKIIKSSTDIMINHDIFYCFGRYDVKRHGEMGFTINTPIPIGSLRLSNFNDLNRKITPEYDICLVSKYGKTNPLKKPLIDEFIYNSNRLDLDVAKLAKNKKLKVVIALRGSPKEEAYYRKIFGDYATYVENKDSESSYRACFSSELIISYQSSMLIEMLASKKKVLHVDYTSNKDIFGYEGAIRLDYVDYSNFEHHVINLLSIDYKIYEKLVKDDQIKFMNHSSSNPPNVIIKNHIDKLMRSSIV